MFDKKLEQLNLEKIRGGIRRFDEYGGEKWTDTTLCDVFARVSLLRKTVETYEKNMAAELLKRKIKTTVIEDLEAKVLIQSRDFRDYDIRKLAKEMKKQNRLDDIWDFVKVVAGSIPKDFDASRFESVRENKFVVCRELTDKELSLA
jgi:hypothetical protein